jgi:hypothetical protein
VFVWKTWSHGALAQGVTRVYGVGGEPTERGIVRWGNRYTTVDYPPIAIYELAAAGALYRLFFPAFENSRWLNVAMKLPGVLAECGLAFLLWRAVRRRYGGDAGRWAAAAFWANPAMILAGPALGYLDPLMAWPSVAALIAATAGAPVAAGALAVVACLTKVQAIFILPVAALALWNSSCDRRLSRGATAAASGALVALAALAPYVAAGAWRNLVQGVGSLLRHDMLSADAANAWWLVTYFLRASYAVADLGVWGAWTMRLRILGISRVIALGYPNPRPIALGAVCLVTLWSLWRARRSEDLALMLACAAVIVHAYFVLGVQVHENHLYLAVPLLAGAAASRPQLRPVLLSTSIVFALNLYLVVGLGRGFPLPPRNLTIIDSTVLLAAANCGLLVWHARRFSAECSARVGRAPVGSSLPIEA